MKFKTILVTLIVIGSLYSCCTECQEEGGSDFSTIYQEKTFPGFFKINGVDVIASEINSTNDSSNDQALLNTISGQNLQNFGLRMFVPTDNTVAIDASVGDVFILKADGINAPAFFESGTVDEISDAYNEGISRQGYTYNFSYPSNAPKIDESNLKGFSIELNYVYTDIASGQVIENKTYNYSLNILFN